MVSLWPWKTADDTASFEKTLSALSTKIKKANATRDGLRTRSRRYKVLWTLYTSLAYLLSALILVLVTGWQNWGPVEYSVIAGSPLVIYLVRAALSSFYDYRLSSTQAYLAGLQKQREEAIEKFKTATKYNSTQQILEKYGAAPPKPPPSPKPEPSSSSSGRKPNASGPQPGRTGMAPPPTANIQRPGDPSAAPSTPTPQLPSLPASPHSAQTAYSAFNAQSSPQQLQSPPSPSAEFAPNAYADPPQYSAAAPAGSGTQPYHPPWYDRVMDLLLGEDETKPSNRLALICAHCRLVNGLAPPGVRALEDVGRWRCSGCNGWNGVDKASEVRQIVKEVASAAAVEGEGKATDVPVDGGAGAEEEDDDGELVEHNGEEAEDDADDAAVASGDGADEPPARSTRSQRPTSKKKG